MLFQIITFLLGLLSTAYFAFYVFVVGNKNLFIYCFLGAGVLLILISFIKGVMRKREYELPALPKLVLITVFILCLFAFLSAEFFIINNGSKKPQKNAKYVLILGASVNGTKITHNLKTRLNAGYNYYKKNPGAHIIVSGGKGYGEDVTEASAMKKYLLEKGVPDKDIILEDKATSTYENFKYSMQKMNTRGDDPKTTSVVIVTNDFHTYRAMGIAKKQGLKNVSTLGSYTHWHTIPLNYIREGIVVIYYKIKGRI